jgi:hypothetical protein
VLAAAVLLVAQRLILKHHSPVAAELLRAALGALLGARGEEDLELGLRGHDRSYVPALGDPIALLEQRALLVHEGRAHRLVRGDPRRSLAHLWRADRLGHVAAVRPDALAELDLESAGRLHGFSPALVGRERGGAVHRTGVEVRVAEPLGEAARDSALPGTGRSVDGDDHARERTCGT